MHAHVHYTMLARNHLDEAVHHSYLQELLNIHQYPPAKSPGTHPVRVAVRVNLADSLKRLLSNPRFHFEERLTSLFWRMLQLVHFIEPEKQLLLDALRSRLSLSAHVSRTRPLPLGPILALRHAILGPSTSDEPWVTREAYAIVHDPHAWDSVISLAGRTQRSLSSLLKPSRLNVLLGLHQLEQDRVFDGSVALERLWDTWMAVLGSEAAEGFCALGIDRTVLLSFVHLAAQCRSSRVVDGAERLLSVQPAMILEQDDIHFEGNLCPNGSLSVSLGAAWACLGTSNLTVLLARMRVARFSLNSGRFPNTYLTKVAENLLALRAPQIAWSITRQADETPVSLTIALASACAQSGHITEAVSLLPDSRLSPQEKSSIALACLRESSARRLVLTRSDALHVCDALGPNLDHVPPGLRHPAVWLALNAGLVRLAGLMGAQWDISPRMKRRLVARLVKARLRRLAFGVVNNSPLRWTKSTNTGIPISNDWGDAIRRGNTHIARASTSRRKRLGGRAQMRLTLTALARLLRRSGASGNNSALGDTRLSFAPDAVTLNIVCRALARCTSAVSSPHLRALFDLISRTGLCGTSSTGNHFGTEAEYTIGGFASSAIALAGLVQKSETRLSFVRHTRPLLKTFIRAFYLRRDEEAARVVVGVLKAEEGVWRSGRAEYRHVE
jgi:hypothetical protein